MNVLVCGANGQLGLAIHDIYQLQSLCRTAKDKYFFTDIDDDFDKLDIIELEDIQQYVNEKDINCIINCAAWTNVDGAEKHKEESYLLNSVAPKNLAQVMKERNGLLIHISTDYVFGNESYNTPCNESQKGTPCGIYGETKLQGEQFIQEINPNYIIIRTSWLYSFRKNKTNFMNKILSLAETHDEVKVVFDQCGTPTNAQDLAKAIYDIVTERKFENNYGIYNYSNEGVCSWYDFAQVTLHFAQKYFDDNEQYKNCIVKPCHSNEFPSKVTRPSYSVLDKTKFKETFDTKIPFWITSLEKAIKQQKQADNMLKLLTKNK